MTSWLLETLLWTAILIAGVLAVRRPVSRVFGPQFAYALWAIPMLRLLLPPIELPAWMRPDGATVQPSAQTEFVILNPAIPIATTDGPAGLEAAASGETSPITPVLDLGTIIEIGIAVWLIGAAIFLGMRFAAYFRLRRELLDKAREVGREGRVRLLETPGTEAPIAFGVIDKVVALPSGFLAQTDRTSRDLALAHELAHHKGRDLLINVLVQPLFALHWWNPLGRYGWLALRRDQEAACDARVIAAQPSETREAYANLIVRFAAGPNVAARHALAAPMACPVLGEKSIIHRLRSLNMTETSHRRRFAGRMMLLAAIVAMPLTATISYAANSGQGEPPAPPEPQFEAPEPPVPPTPPEPALPPAPPEAPALEGIEIVDPDSDAYSDTTSEEVVVIVNGDENEPGQSREVHTHRTVHRLVVRHGEPMNEEEIEELTVELSEGLAEARAALGDLPATIEEALAETRGQQGRTVVRMSCDNSSDEVATTSVQTDGTRMVMVCETRVTANALEGLKQAREQISKSRDLPSRTRERVLQELDRQIDEWEMAIS